MQLRQQRSEEQIFCPEFKEKAKQVRREYGNEVPPVTALQSCTTELRRGLASASHRKVSAEATQSRHDLVAMNMGEATPCGLGASAVTPPRGSPRLGYQGPSHRRGVSSQLDHPGCCSLLDLPPLNQDGFSALLSLKPLQQK